MKQRYHWAQLGVVQWSTLKQVLIKQCVTLWPGKVSLKTEIVQGTAEHSIEYPSALPSCRPASHRKVPGSFTAEYRRDFWWKSNTNISLAVFQSSPVSITPIYLISIVKSIKSSGM